MGTNSIEKGVYAKSSEIDFIGNGSVTIGGPYCETGSIIVTYCDSLFVGQSASVTMNGSAYTTCRALVANEVAVEGYLHLFSPSIQNSFGLTTQSGEGNVYITETGKLEIYASASSNVQWAVGIQTNGGDVYNLGELLITTKCNKTSKGVVCDTLTLLDGSKTEINSGTVAVDADTIKYGDAISCKAGSSSSSAYAATVRAAFGQKYFKAGKKLGGNVIPTSLKSLSKSKRTMTVKWNSKASYFVKGYQIQYSSSSKFKSGNKTVTVKGASGKSKTITKLSKKKYYVRIRSYATVSGKTKYSSWSKSKYITIK